MKLIGVTDAIGVYGSTLHYALVIAFVGSAFILFLYLWKKGKLDMDEEPKYQMMEDDQKDSKKDAKKKEDKHAGRK